VPLQVTLIYHGSDNITNVQIIPIESSPYIVYPNDQQYYLSVMIPNQQYTFTFIGNITPNIPLGVYNFYLQIIYTLDNQVYTQTITVQIPIMGYVQLYLTSQVNGIVFPGEEDVPITLTIYNTGTTPASDVTLFLNSTYPLQFITKTVNVPLIQAGSFTSVQVIANVYNNATIGTYRIPLTALVYGSYYSLNMSITINSNQTIGGKILTPNILLSSGADQKGVPVTLNIIYNGPVPVESYNIQIFLPNGFTNETNGNIIYVEGGSLQPYQEFDISFNVNINNVSLGSYLFPIKIVWNTTEGEGVLVSVVQYSTFTITLMGQPNLEIFVNPIVLYAGSVNNVTLIIQNVGTGNVYNLSLSISSQFSILNALPRIPILKHNQSIKIPIEIYVPSNAEGEPAQLVVTINYLNSLYQSSVYQQELGFYVSQLNAPSIPLIITLNPSIIQPGTFSSANLILTNTLNTELYNISIVISSPIYSNISAYDISYLMPGKTYIIPLTLFSQVSGQYSISVLLTYYENNIQRQEQLSLPIYVMQINTPIIPILINFNSSTLLTGETQHTTLIIYNTLNESLYNITISLSTQGQIYLNMTTITIPLLRPLQKIVIPVEIYTDSSGIVTISATISYYQSGQQRETQEIVNTLAAGSVEIVITGVSSVPSVAVRGGIVSITATIYNFGTGPANGLTVTVFPPKGIEVIGENTYYVGNLGSDTSSTFTFAFRILNFTKAGTYIIPVEYTYTNDIGQVLHSYSNISLTVLNSSSVFNFSSFRHSNAFSSSIILYIILGIITIVIVAIIVIFIRRRGGNE